MAREGEALAALHPRIVVKLSCTASVIRAVEYFAAKAIGTNCTLVFSVGQALFAAKAGATYMSPFVERLNDISEDGVIGSPHREGLPHLWLQNAGTGRFDPSYAAYYSVSLCEDRCDDMPPPLRRSKGCSDIR